MLGSRYIIIELNLRLISQSSFTKRGPGYNFGRYALRTVGFGVPPNPAAPLAQSSCKNGGGGGCM